MDAHWLLAATCVERAGAKEAIATVVADHRVHHEEETVEGDGNPLLQHGGMIIDEAHLTGC